jgi:hypothetical protein
MKTEVIKKQKHLVDVVGKFTPKIVKMDVSAPMQWIKRKDGVPGE